MNLYAVLGAAMAVFVYIPLTYKIWRKLLLQNFATFFLWGLLDAIAAGSIYLDGGENYLLPAVYVVLVAGIVIGILRTKTFQWSWIETMTAGLVVVCLVIWSMVGDREATIASTIATGIAGIPQIVDFWKKPRSAPIWEYVGFILANGVSIFGGTEWSVKERFYATFCTGLAIVFVLIAVRRWLPKFRHQQI